MGDGHVVEVIRGRQHQGAGTDFLQTTARPTERALGEGAAFRDVKIAIIVNEIKGLGQREILLPRAERAAGHANERVGAEIGRGRDGDVTRRDHRDTRVGIRTRQAQGARTELAQAVVGAVTIRNDPAERHHRTVVLGVGRLIDRDITERAADGVVGEADGAGEREVGRHAVEGSVEIDVARELDRVGDPASGGEAIMTALRIVRDRAVIEDERARAERRIVPDHDGLTRIEGREARVIVGRIEDDPTAAAQHGGRTRLHRGGDGTEDGIVRAREDVGAIQIEDAGAATDGVAAAKAVGEAGRSRAEARTDRGRRAGGDGAGEITRTMPADTRDIVRVHKTAEEGLTASERALVDVQVVADRVDGDDVRVGRTGVSIVGR